MAWAPATLQTLFGASPCQGCVRAWRAHSALDSLLLGSKSDFTPIFREGTQGPVSTQKRSPGCGMLPLYVHGC